MALEYVPRKAAVESCIDAGRPSRHWSALFVKRNEATDATAFVFIDFAYYVSVHNMAEKWSSLNVGGLLKIKMLSMGEVVIQ